MADLNDVDDELLFLQACFLLLLCFFLPVFPVIEVVEKEGDINWRDEGTE